MDYKEKYQKALERAKKGLPIDEVFPELKESDDERIRKFLVELVSNDKANNYNGLYIDRGVRFDDVLAYLEKLKDIDCLACDQHLKGYIAGRKVTEEEKQKEQKPAEKSSMLKKLKEHLANTPQEQLDAEFEALKDLTIDKPAEWNDSIAKEMFIKALERAVEQTKKGYELTDCDKHSWWEDFKAYSKIKPAEWSEEDEKNIEKLDGFLSEVFCYGHVYVSQKDKEELQSWLVSLRPYPHWKPSEEQPEVDYNKFEKLFHDFCESNKGHHITSHDACMWFWELGLKGRKEDTK